MAFYFKCKTCGKIYDVKPSKCEIDGGLVFANVIKTFSLNLKNLSNNAEFKIWKTRTIGKHQLISLIGRKDIMLNDEEFIISIDENDCFVEESKNKTISIYLNGNPIPAKSKIKDNDLITLDIPGVGKIDLEVKIILEEKELS